MARYFFESSMRSFLGKKASDIIGELTTNSASSIERDQVRAWESTISFLQSYSHMPYGHLFLEYSIPRMGKRIDAVIHLYTTIFVVEFKVGEKNYLKHAIDQVWDYALDLKYFHEGSHNLTIVPVLICTAAKPAPIVIESSRQEDNVIQPILSNGRNIGEIINSFKIEVSSSDSEGLSWAKSRYSPTPSIVEAAIALYGNHSVSEISKSDADTVNLTHTSSLVTEIISNSKKHSRKSICFITGVPGAGKTLVGLDVATKLLQEGEDSRSVFLSGNGPLVSILREALARDQVDREKMKGVKISKKDALRRVKMFIQNVHNYRDDCLNSPDQPPIDHVAIFDEAQRAWDREQTASFMRRKKSVADFNESEPEFLISCLDRHKDWATVVCLVGGGQEINTGEAGISEWVRAVLARFQHWDIYISPNLNDSEFDTGEDLARLKDVSNVIYHKYLHLSTSQRSFRAEKLSELVKHLLDLNQNAAAKCYEIIREKYPIFICRDIRKSKNWLQMNARGSERYGIMVSSQAVRLKPLAIHVKAPIDPIHWFLGGKEDVRSSYYLEDVATEFQVQGLELEWGCVTWDGDFRYSDLGWDTFEFIGTKWNRIKKSERKKYLMNAYRVLLTRSRQGMIIVVPEGNLDDNTRLPGFYDSTYNYLKSIGFSEFA